ncbi:unnamed protein product [Mytilus edulis]|uniref:CARD domain-containing protein n=1 Tax=Mytilus edulis TaxID=6550 RepID=A0A8S3SAT2_MYTED|nr:unnamed protein product [Mytilus edulis]
MTLLYSTPTCHIAMTLLYSTPTCDIAMTLLYSTPTLWNDTINVGGLRGHLEVVTYLVSQGSQLEATDKNGRTALHHAAGNGHIDVTKWLIDQGCSPWVKTKQGKTPYDMVTIESYDSEEKKRKKKEVMDFLKKNYLKIITDIQHENIVDHLISREVLSVDDGKKIESGKTPQEKNRTLIDMLLCKKEQGFFEFLKALRKDHVYADLADQIEKTLVTSTDISILHKCLK